MASVFIGIGSSIDKQKNVRLGLKALQKEFGQLQISPIYESEAVGFSGCNFYNLVVQFSSELAITELIKLIKEIEVTHGRPKNAIKFAPRTLDLDLLLYDQLIDHKNNLPRAEIVQNAFVLKPLADLAPQLKHPVSHETYQHLWQNYPQDKQKLWRINDVI